MTMQQTQQIWLKEVECPLCYEEFMTENIWQGKIAVVEEYPDLGKKYSGLNPLYYSVWVCPNCLYADLRGDDFTTTGKLNDEDFENDYKILKLVAGKTDFTQARTFPAAITSYKLAILTAKHKKTSVAKIGTFNMRLAWLYRSLKKDKQEAKFIAYALKFYLEAFTTEDEPDFGNMSQGGITYLLGELYRRTGNARQAVNFFQKVVNDKALNSEPKYMKMARLGWESLKDAPQAQEEEDDSQEESPSKEESSDQSE
ncbi:MAG: DUF2225 domain-containing protein [Candidatus Cloacimonetes bacterium]|nr:DUF2225 domain-containing protein [Candidatus Cloacimonadota bacterium]